MNRAHCAVIFAIAQLSCSSDIRDADVARGLILNAEPAKYGPAVWDHCRLGLLSTIIALNPIHGKEQILNASPSLHHASLHNMAT